MGLMEQLASEERALWWYGRRKDLARLLGVRLSMCRAAAGCTRYWLPAHRRARPEKETEDEVNGSNWPARKGRFGGMAGAKILHVF